MQLGFALSGHAQEKGHFVLDAGHGGRDPGSAWEGVLEKDLTLDLAKRVQRVLIGRGYAVTMTRETDVYVGLEERAEVANAIPGSIFISLHFNSHHVRTVTGIETFYWPGSSDGQRLASYIQGELGRRIVTRNRGFKPEQLKVLEESRGVAVVVECGFISNRWERQRCQSSWFKQVLAEEIAQALIRYVERYGASPVDSSRQNPEVEPNVSEAPIQAIPITPPTG